MELARKKTHYNIVAGVLFLLAAVCCFVHQHNIYISQRYFGFHLDGVLLFWFPSVFPVLLVAGMLLCRKKAGKLITLVTCMAVIVYYVAVSAAGRGPVLSYGRRPQSLYLVLDASLLMLHPIQWAGYLLLAVIAVLALAGKVTKVIKSLFFLPSLLNVLGYFLNRYYMRPNTSYVEFLWNWLRGLDLSRLELSRLPQVLYLPVPFVMILGVAAMLFAGLALVRPEKAPRVKASPAARSVSPLLAIEEVKKYKGLLDSGVMTQEEYDEKKKQLLGL